jgi:hypothetical protein
MKLLLAAVLFLLPMSLSAQTIPVQSGAHDGFARLVLSVEKDTGWSFGRTEDGYALVLGGGLARFDLSDVYRRIPRDRISAIWADPADGSLRLRVGCACHAIPFEYRPGVLVIDVRDGPAPDGSSFEVALDGGAVPTFVQHVVQRPKARPTGAGMPKGDAPTYNWKDDALRPLETLGDPLSIAMTSDTVGVDLTALRDGLLRDLGAGAATGVVTLELPGGRAAQREPVGNKMQPHVRVGEDLGMVVHRGGSGEARDPVAADGSACFDDAQLDLAAWGSKEPVSTSLALALSGLVGEFDKPDKQAVERAVKYLLSLGFGAEAAQLMANFPVELPDHAALQAISLLVDGEADPARTFAAMSACDTAAALWAAIAEPDLARAQPLDSAAVIRGFAALPAHLRRYLGPTLADRFLELGEAETARAIMMAAGRADNAADPLVELAQAKVDFALGATHQATRDIAKLAEGNGPAAIQALIALVENQAREGRIVESKQIESLVALVQEYRNAAEEPALRRALSIAQASADAYTDAFRTAADLPQEMPELWEMLANRGSDASLLQHAVLPLGVNAPVADLAVVHRVAERLMDLGLPDPALQWLGPTDASSAPESRLLVSKLQIGRHDGLSAMAALDGLDLPEAAALRARSYALLNQSGNALREYVAIGDVQGVAEAARQAADWPRLMQEDGTAWAKAAELAVNPFPATPASDEATTGDQSSTGAGVTTIAGAMADPAGTTPPSGPLAQGHGLLAESVAARDAIERLLTEAASLVSASPVSAKQP